LRVSENPGEIRDFLFLLIEKIKLRMKVNTKLTLITGFI
jgi:hypothetical protein